jgi:hypothetical protein
MSLTVLPINMQIEVTIHLAMTLDQPMDDLRSLQATCSSMRCICDDPTIDRHLALDQFRCGRTGAEPVDYYALLARLTQVSNPEAYYLIRIQTILMEKAQPLAMPR